jgi:NADPH-dependent 2,4-dienoyl-CoA reductase/sulfur reductase-like enzyme
MLSADEAPPCDRPNLSKDYLAGTAPEEWIPLKGPKFYEKRGIDLRLGLEVARIDLDAREAVAADGTRFRFDRLLLATGAEPIRLNGPGFDRPNVHTLRSLADSRAIVAAAGAAATVAVVGTSFIGLEAAAALRARGLAVHVVGLDAVPMERTLGRELGALVQSVHEAQGVVFHLGESAEAFDGSRLRLSGGGEIACDFVVLGVGVKPRLGLAAAAGLAIDRGVLVDAFLETSRPGVFAAGDIARYPAPGGGEAVRVEHWVAAERQGQAAAANMLGERRPFLAPPFFWSNHYDLAIRYVGNGTGFDGVEIDGSLRSADATVRYLRAGRLVAAASVGRDRENLVIGAELERAAHEGGGNGA